ncbi:MAG: vWA domain-containing protein [Nanoarchaeota archaeon]
MALRKGVFFLIDAMLGILLMVIAVIAISTFFIQTEETSQSEMLTRDSVDFLANIKMRDLDSSLLADMANISNSTRANNSVLEQIGFFWVKNETEAARRLAEQMFGSHIPERYGYSVLVGGKLVYARNTTSQTSLRSSAKMVSGIEEQRPLEGYSAQVFLSAPPYHKASSYAYFGGFVGEGNLTTSVTLPNNYSDVLETYFEGAISADMDIYFNGVLADSITKGSGDPLIADKAVLDTASHSLLHPDKNTVKIVFHPAGNQSLGYIGGGYLRVDTNTTESFDPRLFDRENVTERHYFTGVEGIINQYDSFSVSGDLFGMSAYLHYKSNFSLYNNTNFSIFLNIGEHTVFLDSNVTTEKNATLTDAFLRSVLLYEDMGGKTVPIRFGSNGINYTEQRKGDNDVILITDLSGSMVWQMNSTANGITINNCTNASINNSNTRRISVAKCLDKMFVNLVLNSTGNRVGLVSFSSDADSGYVALTSNKNTLLNAINNYPNTTAGGTCICCALNRAFRLLNQSYNQTRNRFVIMMTDGLPGRRCRTSGSCTQVSQGNLTTGDVCCSGDASDCNNNQCRAASTAANYSSWRVHQLMNSTVHSIGFGPVQNCYWANKTLQDVAMAGAGEYYSSANASELAEIYSMIAEGILSFSYDAQNILITGDLIPATLYPDSYIDLNFTPYAISRGLGEIPLTMETPPFNNNLTNGTFRLPQNATLIDARITSYSGARWTNEVIISNGTQTAVPYNLTLYGDDYRTLGDPYVVLVPPSAFLPGINTTLRINTALSPDNVSGGSPDDRFQYTLLVRTSASSAGVGSSAVGCRWNIEFEDGSSLSMPIPLNYTAGKECYYRNTTYNPEDAIDSASYRLLGQLDLDGNGILDVRIDQDSLQTNVIVTSGVPYLWGPTLVEVRVWQ